MEGCRISEEDKSQSELRDSQKRRRYRLPRNGCLGVYGRRQKSKCRGTVAHARRNRIRASTKRRRTHRALDGQRKAIARPQVREYQGAHKDVGGGKTSSKKEGRGKKERTSEVVISADDFAPGDEKEESFRSD